MTRRQNIRDARASLRRADAELHAYQDQLEAEDRTIDDTDPTYRRLNHAANAAERAVRAAKQRR